MMQSKDHGVKGQVCEHIRGVHRKQENTLHHQDQRPKSFKEVMSFCTRCFEDGLGWGLLGGLQ